MNDLIVEELSNSDVIRSRIFTIRGVQAMLDRDLAELYAKSLLIKFIRRAKNELIVIDAYPGVATGGCCRCENVASSQFQFPIEEAA